MSHTTRLAVVALLVVVAADLVPRRWLGRVLALVAVAVWVPPAGVATAAATALWARAATLRARRRDLRLADIEVVVLGELIALGLAAGMTFVQALRRAGDELTSSLRGEVEGVARAIQRAGSHQALGSAGGRAQRLYLLAARAMATGAPVLGAVESFVDEMRAEARTRRRARLRRLPVTLVIPLALLILPGFVVVALAPALVGSLETIGS